MDRAVVPDGNDRPAAPPSREGRRGVVALAAARRLGLAVVQLWLAATVTFALIRSIPGDPVSIILGSESGATEAQRQRVVEEFGLDRPILVQYADTLLRLARGDLGYSFQLQRPVATVVTEQLGFTVALALAALLVAAVLAVVAAVLVPARARVARRVVTALELLAVSVPPYWLGIMLMLAFSFQLRLFPIIGPGSQGLPGLVLPALALAIPMFAPLSQVLGAEIGLAERQPFATTVRARGATPFQLRVRHSAAHGLLPALTLLGGYLGLLLGGSILIEQVFGRPGIGSVILSAVLTRDTPVLMGAVLLLAAFFIVVNLVVDTLIRVIDPRTAP